MQNYVLGRAFPDKLPEKQGVVAEFLKEEGNILLVQFPNLEDDEIEGMQAGEIKVGLIVENKAILFLWEIKNSAGEVVMTLDSPFDVRLNKKPVFFDMTTTEHRLGVVLFGVDQVDKILKSLRFFTLPKEISIEFLSAVQDQYACHGFESRQEQFLEWMQYETDELMTKANMMRVGE